MSLLEMAISIPLKSIREGDERPFVVSLREKQKKREKQKNKYLEKDAVTL